MPLISKKSVEDIRSRADIVALVGDYTNLKRAGTRWKGLSPFTSEKTPSFFVNPDTGLYYCFSTGQGGDIFKFLMAREGLTFPEAVERVAQRFGIPVEYETNGRAERSMRGELFDLHECAATFFREKFKASEAAAVREYWTRERAFSMETANAFGIGFLPKNASRELIETLKRKHFSERAILGSGMFGRVSEGAPARSRRVQFEARLIIPIRDIQGRVIAFTARKIPGITPDEKWEEAKYKNSSESEIFKKGATLFNIDKAKEIFTDRTKKDAGTDDSRAAPFVLVEGQLDAIRCWENGIRTAVAGQGTGITAQQMQLLARYGNELDCLLDSDAAGQKAAERLAPLAFEAGLDLHFLSVPGGKDPDEFLAKTGTAGVAEIFASKRPAIDFIAERHFGGNAALPPVQKQEALNAIYGILASADSLVFRSECLRALAPRTGLQRVELERDFQAFLRRREEALREREGVPAGTLPRAVRQPNAPLTTLDEDILIFALQYDAFLDQLADNVPPEWIDSGTLAGRVLNRIIAEYSEGARIGAAEAAQSLAENDEERSYIAKIAMQCRPVEHPDETARQCLERLCERYCAREQRKIDAEIAALPPNDPRLADLFRRGMELRKTLKLYKK